MEEQKMAYVAEDPNQPGAAWAITADHPAMKEHNAEGIAGWIRDGAIVRRVTASEAKEMFLRWKRPVQPGEQAALAV